MASGPFTPVKSRGRKSQACLEIVSWRGVFGPRNSAIVKLPAMVLVGVPTGTTSLNAHTALSPKCSKSAECQESCFPHVAFKMGRRVPKPLHCPGVGGLGPGATDGATGGAGDPGAAASPLYTIPRASSATGIRSSATVSVIVPATAAAGASTCLLYTSPSPRDGL